MEKVIQHEHGRYKPVDCRPPQTNDNWPYREHPHDGHDRQYGYKSPKFQKHIFIRRDQIFVDLDSEIGIVEDMRRTLEGKEDNVMSQATEKYKPQFYRWIDKHIGIAKQVMSAFVLEKFKRTSMNSIKDYEEMDIELLMPEYWDDTVFEQLCQAVHDYVVNAVLYEYFLISITIKNPITVGKQEMMEEAKGNIREYCNAAKPGMVKKQHNPF